MIKQQIHAITAPTTVWHPPKMQARIRLIRLIIQITVFKFSIISHPLLKLIPGYTDAPQKTD